MSSRKRIRNESDDDVSIVPRIDDLELDEEMSNSKRMRNESDGNVNIIQLRYFQFTEDVDGKRSEDIVDSEESESSEEMNESDSSDEADPRGALIHEAAPVLCKKF